MAGVVAKPDTHTPASKVDATQLGATDPVSASAPTENDQHVKPRKPRRERLPLPDPIPEASVKRYLEPDRAVLQKDIDATDAELQKCFDKLNSNRAVSDERQKIRDAGRPAFDTARKAMSEINDQCRTLFEERKTLTNQLKDIRDAFHSSRGTSVNNSEIPGVGRDGNEALRNVDDIEQLNARIREYEYLMETQSVSIQEEKKIVAQIAFLEHKGRDYIRERADRINKEKGAKETRIATRKQLEDTRKALDTKIDAAKAKLAEHKKVLDDLRAEEDAKVKIILENVPQVDRAEEKKKIAELKAEVKKMKEDFEIKRDQWYLNERIHYEQQKIIKRKKFEAIQAERDARRKAWEAEQAQYPEPHPYQEEKDLCSGLIVYLQTLLGETVDKPNVSLTPAKSGTAPSLKATSSTREISATGKAIGKNAAIDMFENLAFSSFVKKGGKKSKKSRGRSSQATLDESSSENLPLKTHSIDYLTAFTRLGIKPPNKISEVRAALNLVKEKESYYDTAPAPSAEEKAKKAETKENKQRTDNKKSNGAVDLSTDAGDSAFPGLKSDNSAPARSQNSSMPRYSAVASGVASAPPVIVAGPSLVMSHMSGLDGQQEIMGEGLDSCEISNGGGVEGNLTDQGQAVEAAMAEA